MIWQQNVRIVVMLTNLIEGLGFHSTKCSQYWPELVGNTRRFGGSSPDSQIEVQLYDCQEAPDYLVRKLDISKGDSTRTLVHVQCTSWPDRSAPKNASTLLQLVEVVRMLASQYNQQSGHQMVEAAPWLIHCSAGVGRTGNVYNFVTFNSLLKYALSLILGTFIALDQLLRIFDNPAKSEIDVFNVVYELRKDRRYLVQTLAQYSFLYRCLYEHACKKNIHSE